MHPYITQAVAQARIDDLHREAAVRRRAGHTRRRTGAARPAPGWATLRTVARRLAARTRAVRPEPACCPAT